MRLKLVFVLLCLVVLALAYDSQKSQDKEKALASAKAKKAKQKGLTKKDDQDEDENVRKLNINDFEADAGVDEDEYEEEDDEPVPKKPSKKNKPKKTESKDTETPKKKEKAGKGTKKSKKAEDPMQFLSDNDSIANLTSFDFFAIAREHRIDKLREIINDTPVDDIEKLRQITENVKDEDDDDGEWNFEACNSDTAGSDELCHCDMDEINCSNIVMDTDDPHLKTAYLTIVKKDFKPIYVNFSSNAITRLQRNKVLPDFEKYVSVLDISHNQVRFVDSDVFKPFINLTKLDLSHNNLQTVKKPVFDAVSKTLHRLDLGYNRIKTLEDNVFDGLKNLNRLTLDGNRITVWRKEIFAGLDNLETLSLDNCNITDLPSDIFEYLPKLIGISLRNNPMDEIPAVVANLKSLKNVDMSGTNLTEIRPDAFAGDSDLEEIILEKMPFLSVVRDCGFCGLPKLRTLLLNDNAELFEIHPNAFGYIKSKSGDKAASIVELDLHNSNLTTISEHMINYDKVDSLKLGENPWKCDCATMFLMDERFTFKQDSVAPKCGFPKSLQDRHLATLHSAEACEDARFLGRSGRFSSVLGLGLLAGFIAVGLFYLHSSGKLGKLVRQVRKEPEVAYSNLQSNQEDFALESDFQPRPAEV